MAGVPEIDLAAPREGQTVAPGRIVAGSSLLSTPNQGQIATAAEVISAPGYVTVEQGKDVALIRLATPFNLNGTTVRAIRPVTPRDAATQG